MTDDTTNPYDLATYSFVLEKMEELNLPEPYAITPLKDGVMLKLFRKSEPIEIFIEQPASMDQLMDDIVAWVNGKIISIYPDITDD